MNAGDIQGLGLRALSHFARSDMADRLRLRKAVERLLYHGSKTGFQLAGTAARTFSSTAGTRQRLPGSSQGNGLFDLSLTEEQQMMRESLQRFAADQLRPAAHAADHDAAVPSGLRAEAQALGLAYYAVPEALGGVASEQSTVTQMLAAEDLGHGDFSLAALLLAPIGVANAITRWGSAEQQARYLPAFAGETPPVAALAVTEAVPLFDPMALETTASRHGDGYVLRGSKSLVLAGLQAELLIIAAMLDGKPALFIVEGGSEGLSFRESPAMGLKAAATVDLALDGVRVPASNRLGDDDFDYQAFLDYGYLAWCALAVGTCQAVLDYVVPYCNERVAFGEPISHRQAVAFMIADIAVEVDAMRMLTWRAAARAEAGLSFHRETYLARLLCAEKAMQIGTNGVQLLGGHGFTKEHPVERWYRDLRVVAIAHSGLHL